MRNRSRYKAEGINTAYLVDAKEIWLCIMNDETKLNKNRDIRQ